MSRAVSNSNSKFVCLALIALCGSIVCEGVISVPLTGFQQGIKLQIVPPTVADEQCYVYGVPTPFGIAPEGPTPLSVYTYKNTGSHVIEFEYKSTDYDLAPVFVPGDTIIQVDTSNPSRPLIKFDSNQSPQGKYAYINVQLLDKNKQSVCVSNIALVVEAPLSCLPSWGGYYDTINPIGPSVILPSSGGQIVVPSGNVYAPTYVQNTVVQQFLTVNNVNVNNINIINNVLAITNVTIIQNVTAPPTPAPINCTTNPSAPACQKTPVLTFHPIATFPADSPLAKQFTPVPPARAPTASATPVPPAGGPVTTVPPARAPGTSATPVPTARGPTTGGPPLIVDPPNPPIRQPAPNVTVATAQPQARAPAAITAGRRLRL